MIDEVDQRMEEWARVVGGEVEVSLEVPQLPTSQKRPVVSLYLMEVLPDPAPRGMRETPPLRLSLRYLVTTWAGTTAVAHGLLGRLMFAALQEAEMVVEPEPVAVGFWQSVNLPVRPSFVLRVPLLYKRPSRLLPKVRMPIVIRQSSMAPLFGRVVGPGEMGIMDALVELPSLKLATRTDADGRFYFAAVPRQPPVRLLRVHAKGREINITPERPPALDEPLLIHLKESEF